MKGIYIMLSLLFFLTFSGCSESPSSQSPALSPAQSPTQPPTESTTPSPTAESETIKTFKDGVYLVNKDIDPGLYKIKTTDSLTGIGYIERSKGLTMSTDDIIANIVISGDGYVEIKKTDAAVKLQGVEISPIDLKTYKTELKSEVSDGIYLVGYDIAPGTYKVEIDDTLTGMGYVERMKNASMEFDSIIANEIFQGQGYVSVLETDFAVKVQSARLILQK